MWPERDTRAIAVAGRRDILVYDGLTPLGTAYTEMYSRMAGPAGLMDGAISCHEVARGASQEPRLRHTEWMPISQLIRMPGGPAFITHSPRRVDTTRNVVKSQDGRAGRFNTVVRDWRSA